MSKELDKLKEIVYKMNETHYEPLRTNQRNKLMTAIEQIFSQLDNKNKKFRTKLTNLFQDNKINKYNLKKCEQALTPPNKEELQAEIIKELNCQYSIDDDMFYSEGEWGILMNKGCIDWDNKNIPLSLANKIIKFFELGDE